MDESALGLDVRALPVGVADDETSQLGTTDQGGRKRRGSVTRRASARSATRRGLRADAGFDRRQPDLGNAWPRAGPHRVSSLARRAALCKVSNPRAHSAG